LPPVLWKARYKEALLEVKALPRRVDPFVLILAVTGCLVLLLLSGALPANIDTRIYHLQLVHWAASYKIIPGLANVYPRLGLGSNWFNLIAIFYWPRFQENFTYVNAPFVIWFFLWLLDKWRYHQQAKQPGARELSCFYFILVLYCFFDWQLFREAANSTSYDFPVNAFAMIAIAMFAESVFLQRPLAEFSVGLLLLVIAAVTFKLSGVFLVFLLVFHALKTWRTIPWMTALLIAFVLLSPVLARNYVTTGYPLYPATITFGSADWALPKEMVARLYEHILLSNRYYNYTLSFIHAQPKGAFNWIGYWFHGILWQHKAVLAGCLLTAFLPLMPVTRKDVRRGIAWLLIPMIAMIACWFFTAPDPGRFGYGILISMAAIFPAILVAKVMRPALYRVIMIAAALALLVYGVQRGRLLFQSSVHLIQPESFELPDYTLLPLKTVNLKLPERKANEADCRCYFEPFPCTSQKNPYLGQRGNEIETGFRMNPHPDSAYMSNYAY
jgi:hypothetical protein